MYRLLTLCTVMLLLGQALFISGHVAAQGGVGRPPLPAGIERLPFNGTYEITQVPGCQNHAWNPDYVGEEKKWNEMNVRAFDFGLPYNYATGVGTEVVAAGSGRVFDIYNDPRGSLTVVISHDDNDLVRSYYVHLSAYFKEVNEAVSVGEPIGMSGETGAEGQPHLHFAVTEGGDPATSGTAANINSLPGIPWNLDTLTEDGFVFPCRPLGSVADIAVGGPVAQEPEASVDEPVASSSGYNRQAAVDAAYRHLNDAYVFENDSAWYVSRALWAGGVPMTNEWNENVAAGLTDPSVLLPPISPDGATAPAARANDLVNYLYHNFDITFTQLSWSDNEAGGADLGDVIAYDWEGDGIIDHVAIVTRINEEGYPEVSEHSPTDQNRYWTYSDLDNAFIEAAYPGSVAYLIQF